MLGRNPKTLGPGFWTTNYLKLVWNPKKEKNDGVKEIQWPRCEVPNLRRREEKR